MTTPYSQLTHEQLLSAITERDEQLRVAFERVKSCEYDLFHASAELTTAQKERAEALDEVRQWKESTTQVALESKDVEDELKVALGECVVELEKRCVLAPDFNDIDRDFQDKWVKSMRKTITHAKSLLNERSK
jgi:hypothetical protein